MKTFRTASILLVLTAAFGVSTAAQVTKDAWTPIGSGIGNGTHNHCGRIVQAAWRHDHAQHQSVLWMGTAFGGLWKSMVDAHGSVQQWVPLTDNFPGPHAMGAFLVNRANSNKILIGPGGFSSGAGDGNIYLTHDGGQTAWNGHTLPLNPGESAPKHINRIIEDRSDSTGKTVLACTSIGIYRSTDFGKSWTRRYPLPTGSVEVTDIVQDARTPKIWYAGALLDHAILRSQDRGKHWEPYSPGPSVISGSIGRVSLAACQGDSQVLYALVAQVAGSTLDGDLNGLYRSLDRGRNWHAIFSGDADNTAINPDSQALHTCAIACDPTDPGHIIFGLTKPLETYDAMATADHISWRTITDGTSVLDGGHADYNFFLFRPGKTDIVVANDGGYYIYHPDAMAIDSSGNLLGINATWLRAAQGALASSDIDPSEFIAGLEDNGVVLGDATANTLKAIRGGDGGQVSIRPGMPNVLTETTNGAANRAVSYNSGAMWDDITLGLDANKFSAMLIDPSPGISSPKTFGSNQVMGSSDSAVMYRDVDDTTSGWQLASLVLAPGIFSHVDHTTNATNHDIPVTVEGDQHLYVYTGTRAGLGTLMGVDRTPVLAPLAKGSKADARANADRSTLQPNTIYYTTGTARPSRALFSTDVGKTWNDVTPNLPASAGDPDFNKLIGNPKNANEFYLATGNGVYVKRPAKNWELYSTGLRIHEDVQDIVINSDHANPATLYIATKGRGFWQRLVGAP